MTVDELGVTINPLVIAIAIARSGIDHDVNPHDNVHSVLIHEGGTARVEEANVGKARHREAGCIVVRDLCRAGVAAADGLVTAAGLTVADDADGSPYIACSNWLAVLDVRDQLPTRRSRLYFGGTARG